MPVQELILDPDASHLKPWALNKLRILEGRRSASGKRAMGRSYVVGPHVVRVEANASGGKVLITALLGLLTDEAAYPLWSLNSTRLWYNTSGWPHEDFGDQWLPTVQHISTKYPGSPVPGAGGPYVTRHWLVVCRFCKRVAEYTWDEEATLDDDGNLVITGQYVSHDGTDLTRCDRDADGNPVNETVVAHGLQAAADANPWGVITDAPETWFDGDLQIYPGPSTFDSPYYTLLNQCAVNRFLRTSALLAERYVDVAELNPHQEVSTSLLRRIVLIRPTVRMKLAVYHGEGAPLTNHFDYDGPALGLLMNSTPYLSHQLLYAHFYRNLAVLPATGDDGNPAPRFILTLGDCPQYKFDYGTRQFTAMPPVSPVNVNFSRSAELPVEYGDDRSVTGLFCLQFRLAASVGTDPWSGHDPLVEYQMTRACLSVTNGDYRRMIYKALYGDSDGTEWRSRDRIVTFDSFSYLQPAVV